MAIVKFGVAVVGIRGTVGGLTFSVNKSGPYAKQWSRSSNPKTVRQSAQRAILASIPAEWRDLSTAERALWDDFAELPAQDLTNPFGETYSIPGWGWFNKINIRLIVMGRAVRTAVPTQTRPSAPSITDLEFPFDDGQTAFVEYASGEFDPDFDLVLEVAQAGSIGRAAPPSSFAEFVVAQDPDDTQTGFATPYVNRLGIGNASLTGFLRMYRQTTDGLRSSAASATFIASDQSNYAPSALDYDGTNDFALRGADLTGSAESKVVTFAAWFKIDGGDGSFRAVCGGSGSAYQFRLTSANKLQLTAEDNVSTTVVSILSANAFLAGSGWHSALVSVDTATQTAIMYVDDAEEELVVSTLALDALMDFTVGDHAFGSRVGGSQKWDGCLSSYWFSITDALDFSDVAIRRIFLSPAGDPLDLGDSGQLPTGTPPIVYAPGGDASNNVGSGGNYVNQAGSSACSSSP